MKRLLLSMAVLFAFTMSSQAQYGPGPGGGGGASPLDLVFAPGNGLDLPSPFLSLSAGSTFSASFTIFDSNGITATSDFTVRMRISINGSPADDFYATVTGFTTGQTFANVTVSFVIPSSYSGNTLSIDHILIDSSNDVVEASETNNYVPSYYFASNSYIIL